MALLTFLCRRVSNQPVVTLGALRSNPPAALEAVRRSATEGDATIESLAPPAPAAP